MRLVWFVPVLVGLWPAVPACRAQNAPPSTQLPSVVLPPELDRVLRDYERAWRERAPSALADLFTVDGFVLRPGHPPIRGRPAILEAYGNSGGPLSLRALGFAVADTVGYIVGGFSGRAGEPDAGKFVLALRRDASGRWLIAADMDNGNQRP